MTQIRIFSRPLAGMTAVFALMATSIGAEVLETSAGPMTAEPMVEGLDVPWAFDFLPDGALLVTEREGRLLHIKDGTTTEVRALPSILAQGQGGLLDVMVASDFAESREVYLTYAKRQFVRGSGTAVYKATLTRDGSRLRHGEMIFQIARGSGGGFHFGSRLVEAPDGSLFVTIGDRGDPDQAQNLSMHNGSVLRITRDGDPHPENPFLDTDDALPEIWSFGHRNPQGAALDPTGQLWVNEHGARGGDEVNRIEPGVNYGWPVIAYGVNYDGTKIGEGQAKDGLQQPVHYWDPSIAPSGMAFMSEGNTEAWDGNGFVGSLKFDYIARMAGDPMTEVEQIKGDATIRVRDLAQGPDGALWFLSVGNGTIYRLVPAADS